VALNKDLLTDGLRACFDPTYSVFKGYNGDPAVCADRVCDAFGAYAQAAQAVSEGILQTPNLPGMKSSLEQAWAASKSAEDASLGLANALAVFWLGATFQLAGAIAPGLPGTSGGNGLFGVISSVAVTTFAITPMHQALLAEFGNKYAGPQKSAAIAAVIHDQLPACVVVETLGLDTTPPPSGPLPIENRGTIS
jgi:hypothetical protein